MLLRLRIKGRTKFYKISPGWIVVYLFMIAMVLFTAIPLIYMINTAFKPLDELFLFPPRYFVRRPTIQNFYDLVEAVGSSTVPFSRYVLNSIIITVASVITTVISSSFGAYGLVKHKPLGSKTIFAFILAAMMFAPQVTQIPRYMVMNKLQLIDTFWALILPEIAVAYNFFLMKQFIEQFPDELIEAGRIDGANEARIFMQIVMPSLAPAWSTLIVFSFVSNWNDFFSPLVYLHDQSMRTLPLAMKSIAGSMGIGRAGAVAASTLLMTMPTVILFTLMQKKVMKTMVHSGIKG